MPTNLSHSGPRFLDLFCGIGGLSLGLEQAGLTPIGGVDAWEQAIATFRHNHPGARALVGDLTQLTLDQILAELGALWGEIDVVVGGPPCQGFSTVGKRDGSDPRNLLWRHFHAVVAEAQPAYVVLENVEGLNVLEKGEVRESIIEEFNRIGYGMKAALLRAADFGVPQLRKRMVFLGWRDGLVSPDFPRRSCAHYVTVADALFDLPALNPGEAKTDYDKAPTTLYQAARRGDCTRLANHEAANHPARLVEVLKHIPDGGNRKSIPAPYQPTSGFHNSYARLASWRPAIAVTSNMRKPSSARATHPAQHRGLTVREGLRLQSFDDRFVVLGSRTSQYLQVGNAVPPLFALAIGREVVKAWGANSPSSLRRKRQAARGTRALTQRTLWDAAG